MKKLLLGAVGALALGCSAEAASLNFAAYASGNEGGVADGTVISFGDVDVAFSANGTNVAYFDDISGGRPAGLGVCGALTSGGLCTPNDDDNITAGEEVTLGLGATADLSGFGFRDADHFDLATSLSTLLYAVNGGAMVETTFAAMVGMTLLGVDTISFAYGGANADQFYVNILSATPVSTVPLPGAAPLMLGGLGLFGALTLRRRRRCA